VLDTLDEGEAVRQADLARPQMARAKAPIIESLPPILSILSPTDDFHFYTAKLTIDYLVRSPSGTSIDGVEALIHGAPAGSNATGDDSDVRKCIAETHGLGRTTGALPFASKIADLAGRSTHGASERFLRNAVPSEWLLKPLPGKSTKLIPNRSRWSFFTRS